MKNPPFMNFPHRKPQNTSESCKKIESLKITRPLGGPTNQCTLTSDPQINAHLHQIAQDSPTSHPIIPKYHPHECYNLPARVRCPEAVERFVTLKLFLTTFFMRPMTCNTNAYAKTSGHQQEGGRRWKEVSTLEVGIWLEIVHHLVF